MVGIQLIIFLHNNYAPLCFFLLAYHNYNEIKIALIVVICQKMIATVRKKDRLSYNGIPSTETFCRFIKNFSIHLPCKNSL